MRTLLVSALVASASAASAASAFIYEASEPASLVAPGPICSAKAQAFFADLSGPGEECDPMKEDWCSDNKCKTSASSFYEACKAGPAYGPVPGVTAVKSAMALMGCDPTATEGA